MNSEKQTGRAPDAVMSRAQALLDDGIINEAMAYFWHASEGFAGTGDWEKAGDCLFKAAYCYELDARYKEAAEDYEGAAELYTKGDLSDKALQAQQAARNAKKLSDPPGLDKSAQTIVVGAVGLNGSGKDEVIERLRKKFGVPTVSTGDITREIAQAEGIEPTRDKLHAISQRCWAEYGREYYPRRVIRKIAEQGWRVAAVTGIRTPIDVRVFRDRYGEDFILVHVEVTDPRVRFERVVKRGEARDPRAYQEFLQQDESEEAVFRLQETISMATMKINNDGSLEEFHAAIDELASQMGLSPHHGGP